MGLYIWLYQTCFTLTRWGEGGGGGGGVGAKRKTRGGEMFPSLAIGWQASAVRGEEAGRLREVASAGVPILVAGGPRPATDT